MGKYLLFIFVMFMVMPAFAESFPNDEYMQENTTYNNSAIYDNTGVYSGSVNADAEYNNCTAGNYCPGTNSSTEIISCSTLENGAYPNSEAGATASTECYRACTTSNIQHSSAVTGNDYYGAGVDTCVATSCENGYHVDSNVCVGNTINLIWNGATAAAISANNAGTMTYGGDIRTPQSVDSTQIPRGKRFRGWKFAYDFSTLNVTVDSRIAAWAKTSRGCRYCNPSCSATSSSTCTTYPEFANMDMETWRVQYSWGDIYGKAVCSITSGDSENHVRNTIDETGGGSYCWCKVTGYTPNGASVKLIPSNNVPWVMDLYNSEHPEQITAGCDGNICAIRCSVVFGNISFYKNAMLGITE